MIEKFNKRQSIIDTTNYEYKKLVDYNEKGVICFNDIIIINKNTKFSDKVILLVVCQDKVLLNLPKHLHETILQIVADVETMKAVHDGQCGFVVRPYISKYNNNCYTIDFVTV